MSLKQKLSFLDDFREKYNSFISIESQGGEYDCQEDGVLYYYRKYPDFPKGYKEKYTDTWQECHKRCLNYKSKIQYLTFEKKRCLEFKQCKGFTWHKDKHRNPKLSRACSLFSTYSYKGDGNSVSGLRECSGELKTRSKGIGGGMGGCLDGWMGWWVETRVPKTSSA